MSTVELLEMSGARSNKGFDLVQLKSILYEVDMFQMYAELTKTLIFTAELELASTHVFNTIELLTIRGGLNCRLNCIVNKIKLE